MSPLIFAIHHEQQRGGKGWKKGLAQQGAALVDENSRERKSEKMVLV